jgi:hypothetical protein
MATNKSVLSQLQSVGEDALGRLTKSPATRSALEKGMQLKDRAGKSLSGLEDVERRLTAIEKRLSALEGKRKPAATRPRSTTTRKTAPKPPGSTPGSQTQTFPSEPTSQS